MLKPLSRTTNFKWNERLNILWYKPQCFIRFSATEKSRIGTWKITIIFTRVDYRHFIKWHISKNSSWKQSCVYVINRKYMGAWRYGIYLLVFKSISHSFAALTRSISIWSLEDKFHISARHSLFTPSNWGVLCTSVRNLAPSLIRIIHFERSSWKLNTMFSWSAHFVMHTILFC